LHVFTLILAVIAHYSKQEKEQAYKIFNFGLPMAAIGMTGSPGSPRELPENLPFYVGDILGTGAFATYLSLTSLFCGPD
jgi:hypothetical protein